MCQNILDELEGEKQAFQNAREREHEYAYGATEPGRNNVGKIRERKGSLLGSSLNEIITTIICTKVQPVFMQVPSSNGYLSTFTMIGRSFLLMKLCKNLIQLLKI